MKIEQLTGRYTRLKQELASAYRMNPCSSRRIDRLANDLYDTEMEIAAYQRAQEHEQDAPRDYLQ